MQKIKPTLDERSVSVPIGDLRLAGNLVVPHEATGAVVFAHGSGSSRHSPRNRYVAEALNHAGLATLLLDLLTEDEEEAERYTRHLRFDVSLLAERLMGAVDWLAEEPDTAALPVGCFGAKHRRGGGTHCRGRASI